MMKIFRALMLTMAFMGVLSSVESAKAQVDEASELIQYLHDEYGMQMAQPAVGQITCQSGGQCYIRFGGQLTLCTCGGGTVCSSSERCKCKCSASTNQVSCGYECETKPPPVSAQSQQTDLP
jgi:hypothetical protein